MSRTRRYGFPLFAALCVLLPGVLAAHELDVSVSSVVPAVIVRATYGGSEPLPFAKVQVFAPAMPSQEFQAGRTDRRGYFSFVPERGGSWRVVVDDEEGHRREVDINVPDPTRAETHATTQPGQSGSRVERALLGLALIVGFTGFFYGFKARRRS